MIFFVTGASGAGKTAVLDGLRERNDAIWFEFDSIGVPANPTTAWRQSMTDLWLRRTIEYQSKGQDVGVSGQMVYGEILACPSASQADRIAVCLLDCHDIVRVDRLRRAKRRVDQDTLNWAAWLRMHAVDPQWRPDVIRNSGAAELVWERWKTWQRDDPRWKVWLLDTTALSISEVVERTSEWIREEKSLHRNAHP